MAFSWSWLTDNSFIADYILPMMTDKEKCKSGIYDSVDIVIIRLKKILSDYKISKKVRNALEDIRDNNWQGKNDS